MTILLGSSQRRKKDTALVTHTGVYKASTGYHLPWSDTLWKLLPALSKQQTSQTIAGENWNSEKPRDSYNTVGKLVTDSNPDLLTCGRVCVFFFTPTPFSWHFLNEHTGQLWGGGLGQCIFQKQIMCPGTEQIRSLSPSQTTLSTPT